MVPAYGKQNNKQNKTAENGREQNREQTLAAVASCAAIKEAELTGEAEMRIAKLHDLYPVQQCVKRHAAGRRPDTNVQRTRHWCIDDEIKIEWNHNPPVRHLARIQILIRDEIAKVDFEIEIVRICEPAIAEMHPDKVLKSLRHVETPRNVKDEVRHAGDWLEIHRPRRTVDHFRGDRSS